MKPVWEVVGMTQMEYVKLPWTKKRPLIIRANGIRMQDSCYRCGKKEWRMKEERVEIPKHLKDYKFGYLVSLYLLWLAK